MRMYNKNVGINNFANQKQGGENVSKELFVRAEEVAGVLGISKPYAYKLVREMRQRFRPMQQGIYSLQNGFWHIV